MSGDGSRGERGAVTAELAVGLVGVLLVLAAVLAVGQAVVASVRATDAAAAGARAAARGEPASVVRSTATSLAGGGAAASTTVSGGQVVVEVSVPVVLVLPGRPVVQAHGRAVARLEDGAGAPAGPGAP